MIVRHQYGGGQSSSVLMRLLGQRLSVSRSGYYDYIERQPSVTEIRLDELAEEIRTIHAAVKNRYGSPRMHKELMVRGHPCSVNLVAKIIKGPGIQAISQKKFRASTTDSNHDFRIPVSRASLFDYIEVFFNRIRRHSSSGMPPQRISNVLNILNRVLVFRGELQSPTHRS